MKSTVSNNMGHSLISRSLGRPRSETNFISLYAILLLTIFTSCTSQNPTERTENLKPKTTLHLNFQSGIRAILEDHHGNTWFGSHSEGICRFDGENFTYFTVADGLCHNQIRSIYEDADGVVWFEGGEGISRYDGEKIITHTINYFNKNEEWQVAENDIWFKGGGGVYRYDGQTMTYHLFPVLPPRGLDYFYTEVSTPFVNGKNKQFWFGTYSAVIGYDGLTFTVIDDQYLGLSDTTGYLHVRSIYEDTNGDLWIGNNGIGVLKYDRDTTINFSAQQNLISKNSLLNGGYRSPPGSLEHVFAIGEDRDGNIWFGDRDTGAWRYDGKTMKNYGESDGLTVMHIWQFYNSKNGELWLAMDNGSVLKFDEEGFIRIF